MHSFNITGEWKVVSTVWLRPKYLGADDEKKSLGRLEGCPQIDEVMPPVPESVRFCIMNQKHIVAGKIDAGAPVIS